VFLVVALLAVGGVLVARLVSGTAPDPPSTPGQTGGFGAPPEAPAFVTIPDEAFGGPTEPTGPTGPIPCTRPSGQDEIEPSARAERAATAALTADYRFEDSASSSVGSAPDLVRTGTGQLVFREDPAIGKSVLAFTGGRGLSLTPTDGVIDNARYTIELVFSFGDRTGYAKIIDFRMGTEDSGLYSLDGCLNLYPEPPAPTRAIRPGSYVQVVLTRSASGRVLGYVDGVRQFSIRDANEFAVIDDHDTLWFFRDDELTQGEFAEGTVARIRLYDRPLTDEDVAALACGEIREILSPETCRPARG
jgi:hypothetical protein